MAYGLMRVTIGGIFLTSSGVTVILGDRIMLLISIDAFWRDRNYLKVLAGYSIYEILSCYLSCYLFIFISHKSIVLFL